MTVTLLTEALASEARPPLAWALMTEANVDPSCSRLTRCATGVLGLKKATQFAAIAFSAAAEEADDVDDADGAAAADDDGAVLGAELLLLPLLHAARLTPMAKASRMQETNLRVFTQTFSSFPLSLAMSFLTLTSAGGTNGPPPAPECPWSAFAVRCRVDGKPTSGGDMKAAVVRACRGPDPGHLRDQAARLGQHGHPGRPAGQGQGTSRSRAVTGAQLRGERA